MNTLELKSIAELQDMAFYIPAYQRGYRWTQQQVKDLLKDILEFSGKKGNASIYCLQPLVIVKRLSDEDSVMKRIHEAKDLNEVRHLLKEQWEVVDGQQRLTTIRLILEVLQQPHFYDIEYETRKNSASFLDGIMNGIPDSNVKENIDYYYIKQAVNCTNNWLKGKDIDRFRNVLLHQVKFIWYETQENNPKEVFTRLNIGKISLTNAELIKALLLNKSNFPNDGYSTVRLRQQEIAMEWDVIEYTLQSNEFWLFLNEPGNERSTRIDFIFDMICQEDMLHCKDDQEIQMNGDLKTFRYFNHYFETQKQKEEAIQTIWEKVKEIFQTLQEWFDDKELYHYIGFLICIGKSVNRIYRQWTRYATKSAFRENYLMKAIKESIRYKDIENTVYEVDAEVPQEFKGGVKQNCRPILLLHNLQTVINQNNVLAENKKYREGVFYKFPFHLYKSEDWDVEHIDSNTENKLNDIQSQREWLLNAYFGLQGEAFKEIRKNIKDFFEKFTGKNYEQSEDPDKQKARNERFEELRSSIDDINGNIRLSQIEKNKIWNFALLDSSTNRSYGNAIFPAKRRVIIGKDQGKRFFPPTVDENGAIVECKVQEGQSSFIPPCTKSVFLKYYNAASSDFNTWNKEDAIAYMNNIKDTLKEFLL
ncbi:DUF262 domain-containing protein [Bacteroides finegoldii]|jgi:uncharacterized protein with ParB-like and HNH nuclease domain|uniref:DUF262 domain-containing protein n=2 Tax=Bacteroides finegoldii TaxID=338188 RepID=A0A7J4YR42_9BACE|nr:DUF262 domain-containing protein [Bacteroides finegoldii]EEX47360.1 hypothetical protein BACFIN_04742 [Bacteroides finegoldii DSM 17565]KAA5218674.1 DUF262 domain-containing protein [Bacteroides finegoldii]KAA5222676.1 DUF262 domain-containing protein [Bacteroides finegoldii]KAA5227076.1 DUF262 domain-containing protein [Bacteroides finegoldii]KAA5231189.1 DUF262 domain-containing protein [Bacteroides finegoldii]